jgi:hypothetical protein
VIESPLEEIEGLDCQQVGSMYQRDHD